MASLTEIRAAIAASLAVLPDCQVSAYMLANPTPPCIDVFPDPEQEIVYDRAMQQGAGEWNLIVRGRVAFSTDQGAQMRLDEWIASSGPGSVKAAVEADCTLGGAAEDLIVRACRAYQLSEDTGVLYLAAEWSVRVLAQG